MTQKTYTALAVAVALGAMAPAWGQWPSEPATAPIQVTGNGNSPLVVADHQGGAYVSFRNGGYNSFTDSGGFDIFLQHYDAQGNQSWPEPVLLFDTFKRFASSYDTVVDEEGNAYVANDIYPANNPSEQSTVQVAKVNKDGSLAWESPLNLTPGADLQVNGLGLDMAAKGEHIVVTWAKGHTGLTVDGFSGIACLDKDGKLLWSQDVQLDGRYTYATKPVVTDDAVLVLLEVGKEPGTTQSHYQVQKYALADGKPLWPAPVAITSGDNLQHAVDSARSMDVMADGEGGMVIGWRHPTGPNLGILLLQHLHGDGTKSFPGQGLRVSGEHQGNGAASLAYDGDQYYFTWLAYKNEPDEEGFFIQHEAIKAVAVSRDGKFTWNPAGETEPGFVLPWKALFRSGPVEDWFSGYQNPEFILNEAGQLNLTYGVEGIPTMYSLQAQVIDANAGTQVGDVVTFSDGSIQVGGRLGLGRTLFGQPLLAYTQGGFNGPVNLLNFDGNANSGVSQDILVEKPGPVLLAPGEQQRLELKVLDNIGSAHEAGADSGSSKVDAGAAIADKVVTLELAANDSLADSLPVVLTVQDLDRPERVVNDVIKVRAPRYLSPRIQPLQAHTLDEGQTLVVEAQAASPQGSELVLDWQQTAGPAVAFRAEGASLTLEAGFVAEDTQLEFTLSADDGTQAVSQVLAVKVVNTGNPVISGDDAQAAPGATFTLTPAISGAKAPVSLSWSQTGGARTVFTMSPDGTLTGTAPLTEGEVTLALSAEDANGEIFSKAFRLTVAEPVQPDTGSGGGSFGFATLFLGLLALARRTFGTPVQRKS
ncbi:hypothetical protein [Gallaecimonas sp. GXIMD4217]|uniref:hypothetical protein n=1 Tax=Gallaecimonas sp. GXIMD4217 TaxID=3131927 RepID=UPI00311B154D